LKTKNKIIKIIIISLLLFINIKNAKAAGKAYTTKEVTAGTTDLIIGKSATDTPGFIVCSYACSSDNVGANESNCGNEASNFSAIYYYFNSEHKWGIKTNIYLSPIKVYLDTSLIGNGYNVKKDKDAEKVITQYTYEDMLTYVPTGGIYFEAPISQDKNRNWQYTEQYKALSTSFECPQYMYYDHTIELSYDHADYKALAKLEKEAAEKAVKKIQDKADNAMELCYANETDKCSDRYEKDKTQFGKANGLSYNLLQELNVILDETNTELNNISSNQILDKSFGTQDDICTAMKNKNYDALINPSAYETILNEIIKRKTYGPNADLMEVQNIEKLLLPEKGYNTQLDLKYNSESLTEKYNQLRKIYMDKTKESVEYYANECKVDNSTIDYNRISDLLEGKIDKIVTEKIKIDTSELDCDTLFADMADIIRNAYFILEIVAVLIVIIRTALDYSKVFLSDDKDQLKKANDKLIKRIVILIIILLLPALINLFLKIFKIEGFNSENPLCVRIK